MKGAAGVPCVFVLIWRTCQNYANELAGAPSCGSCMEGLLLTLREGGGRCSMLLCYNLEDMPKLCEGVGRCSIWVVHGGLAVDPPLRRQQVLHVVLL